jgi:hypothetical protein
VIISGSFKNTFNAKYVSVCYCHFYGNQYGQYTLHVYCFELRAAHGEPKTTIQTPSVIVVLVTLSNDSRRSRGSLSHDSLFPGSRSPSSLSPGSNSDSSAIWLCNICTYIQSTQHQLCVFIATNDM